MFVTERKWQRPWFTQSTEGWTVLHLQCIENDLNGLRAVFHKLYNESEKLSSFVKIFQQWLFQKFEFLNYQKFIKAYKKGVFNVFEKIYQSKKKKIQQ